MPVIRDYPVYLPVSAFVAVLDSLGAHLSAKLAQFGTDERTLTDELCDMFLIWSEQAMSRPPHVRTPPRVRHIPDIEVPIVISKTTQQAEAQIGADLAITITSPEGTKRALLQAKVLDPQDNRLRCDSSEGWQKLWSQLVLMRQVAGKLAFLLLYVPGGKLDSSNYGYGTWEQQRRPPGGSSTECRFGVTIIPVDDLLDNSGRWSHAIPVRHDGDGTFTPPGLTLLDLFIDLLACNRGVWQPETLVTTEEHFPIQFTAYREIGASFAAVPIEAWRQIVSSLREGPPSSQE